MALLSPLPHSVYCFKSLSTRFVRPATHDQMVLEYPITGLVEGWYFRQQEVSAGCWVVEGSDLYGRKISRQGVDDPQKAMAECIEFARKARGVAG